MARWTAIAALISGLLATPAAAQPSCHLGLGGVGAGCCCSAAKADLPPCCREKAERAGGHTKPGIHAPRCRCRAAPAQPASPAQAARATTAATAVELAILPATSAMPPLVADCDLCGVLDYGPRSAGPPLRVLICAWRI